ncbi:MAG: exodeoxyribonuclease VII large subunit [Clostridiales bacterium]|jgi:exodeoxyribonuclease VII large subunit|nr:exodeoxyribonuclease VII large subunit [Clostridiales bacterium]
MLNRRVFSVSQVNRYVKRQLEDDALLGGLFVEGELSGVKLHSSGHMYFSLKDADASVNAVMFRSYTQSLKFSPKNGL